MERKTERTVTSNQDARYSLGTGIHQYDKPFPYYSRPVEFGHFSVDAGQLKNDRSQLRTFVPPDDWNNCSFNLRDGYENMTDEDEDEDENVDAEEKLIDKGEDVDPEEKLRDKGEDVDPEEKLRDKGEGVDPGEKLRYFTWIMQNPDKFIFTPSTHPPAEGAQTEVETNDGLLHSLNVDFVCGRTLLTKLLCTPYERTEDIGIIVMRFRGTFFMRRYKTELRRTQIEQLNVQRPWEKLAEKAKETQEEPVETPEEQVERPDYDEICYWGFKFEQYVTAEAGSEVPDTHSPVILNRGFEIALRSQLGPHSLLFFVEVDCEDKNCTEGSKYVELKTSRLIESEKQYKNFCRYKLLKWWAQSFVGGVPRVVCGFRDDYGVVRKLEEFQVLKMPHMASSSVHHPWKPAVCFNFLSAFLDFVKSVIDEERCVYVFHRKPDSDMICMKVDEIPYYAFFPEKFIKWDAWDKPCLPEDSATDLFLPAFVQIPKNP